jgi:hypothetical protein
LSAGRRALSEHLDVERPDPEVAALMLGAELSQYR